MPDTLPPPPDETLPSGDALPEWMHRTVGLDAEASDASVAPPAATPDAPTKPCAPICTTCGAEHGTCAYETADTIALGDCLAADLRAAAWVLRTAVRHGEQIPGHAHPDLLFVADTLEAAAARKAAR